MLTRFSRQRVLGVAIVVLACALCFGPIFWRGKGARAATGSPVVVTQVAHYPPSDPSSESDSAEAVDAHNREVIEARLGRPLPSGMVIVDDIVAMSRAGVPEAVIISHIKTN